MWQEIVVGAVVLLAALYVVWSLKRAASGQTACQKGLCADCPLAGECESKEGETEGGSGEVRGSLE